MKCKHCNEDKPSTDFYVDRVAARGFVAFCKPCYELRRKKRIDPLKENARVSRWNKKTNYAALKKMRAKYPEKYKARWALQYAVSKGRVIKPLICSVCKEQKPLSAHHSDYTKPLDVVWLCRHCHEGIHHPPT